MSEMYGSFDGILGGTLPAIALLDSSNASPDQVDGHANDCTPQMVSNSPSPPETIAR